MLFYSFKNEKIKLDEENDCYIFDTPIVFCVMDKCCGAEK